MFKYSSAPKSKKHSISGSFEYPFELLLTFGIHGDFGNLFKLGMTTPVVLIQGIPTASAIRAVCSDVRMQSDFPRLGSEIAMARDPARSIFSKVVSFSAAFTLNFGEYGFVVICFFFLMCTQ